MTAPTPTPVSESGIFNSPTYRLITAKLGEDPATFIAALRERDQPMPFAKIADEIHQRTGEYVTNEIPRRWFLELQRLREVRKNTPAA